MTEKTQDRAGPRVAIPVPHSEKQDYNQRVLPQYIQAIENTGLDVVTISPDTAPAEVARIASHCQGVVLPGSPADVDPEKYGAQREPACNPADAARDTLDELLLQDAHNMHKPVLAICYGLQSLNVWRTGSLLQDIHSTVNHECGPTVETAHHVEIDPNSRLGNIVSGSGEASWSKGKLLLPVNSSHHQSALVVGDGLRVVARCPEDGIVEAIEAISENHWVTAVQWHPERSSDEASRRIFSAFRDAVCKWKPRDVTESVV